MISTTVTKTRCGVVGCFILQQNCTSKSLEHGNRHLCLDCAGKLTKKTIIEKENVSSTRLIFISSFFQQGQVQRGGNNLFEHEKEVFQIIGVVLPTEQIIKSFTFNFQDCCFNFKLTFTVFKKFMNDFWNDFRRAPHDDCFYKYVLYRN